MTTRAVIQARMGSTRLPGKIMAPLAGQPLLWHVVRRLEAAFDVPSPRPFYDPRQSSEVLVATTTQPADDLTAYWCAKEGITCFRGDDRDVLGRYLAAVADLYDDDTLVRATADNPLYCPQRTAAIVAEHQRQSADYTCIRDLSYVVPEVIQVGALRRMADRTSDPYCREHVTPYFRQRPTDFRSVQLPVDWRGLRPELRLTVDTADELSRMQKVFDGCSQDGEVFSLEDAYVA